MNSLVKENQKQGKKIGFGHLFAQMYLKNNRDLLYHQTPVVLGSGGVSWACWCCTIRMMLSLATAGLTQCWQSPKLAEATTKGNNTT
jgi:hypothetical protein